MRFVCLFLVLFSYVSSAQLRGVPARSGNDKLLKVNAPLDGELNVLATDNSFDVNQINADTIAPINKYRGYNDYQLIAVDTSLTIKTFFTHNYLKKDQFFAMPLANDGTSYNQLNQDKVSKGLSIGFNGYQQLFLKGKDIFYYNVPTSYSRLSYRSGIEQGQNMDAFLTTNVKKNINLFIGYRGLRSLGLYLNELRSLGNFNVGGSYQSLNKKYDLKAYFLSQYVFAQENGGITELDYFKENENNRDQVAVRLKNALGELNNKRFYIENNYSLAVKDTISQLKLKHKFSYDSYKQVFSQQGISRSSNGSSYFGDYYSNSIADTLQARLLNNDFYLQYKNSSLGKFSAGVKHTLGSYGYKSVVVKESNEIIPSRLSDQVCQLVTSYKMDKVTYDLSAEFAKALTSNSNNYFNVVGNYHLSSNIKFQFRYDYTARVPDFSRRLFQSSYVFYNWNNDFVTEKVNRFDFSFQAPVFKLNSWFQSQKNTVFYIDQSNDFDEFNQPSQLLVVPYQNEKVVTHFGLDIQKSFNLGKFTLDNRLAYQQVLKGHDYLNLPMFNFRETMYYTDYMFDKALFFQVGFTAKYFTEYYANGYHPILGDFYVQNHTKVGGFPMVDIFLNMKIQTARIYLAAEQLNQLIGESAHYSAPGYPYRDFTLRLGVVWSFFN